MIRVTKKELRTEIKNRINGLSEEYKKKSSTAIAEKVLSSPVFINAKNIFIYVSTENEPGTSAVIREALKKGKRVFVPKCLQKGIMIPAEVFPDTVFTSGYMGIPEPKEYDINTSIAGIDLSVIPCLSANKKGDRLGHGAGFYDRFLAAVKTEKMCLCFAELISDEIPTDSHDVKMDYIVTEKGSVKI